MPPQSSFRRRARPRLVLPIDARAFRAHARLMHRKSDALFEDAMIAAVAQTNGLILATRNVKDFAGVGVKTVDLT